MKSSLEDELKQISCPKWCPSHAKYLLQSVLIYLLRKGKEDDLDWVRQRLLTKNDAIFFFGRVIIIKVCICWTFMRLLTIVLPLR